MFSSVVFGDEKSVAEAMNLGRGLCDPEHIATALSIANTQIKGILVFNCIPYEFTCKNKIHIDNIANLFAIAQVYLFSESYSDSERNKYTMIKAEADDLLNKFLNNFTESCNVQNKASPYYFVGDTSSHNSCSHEFIGLAGRRL